jgi:hypothetical protein
MRMYFHYCHRNIGQPSSIRQVLSDSSKATVPVSPRSVSSNDSLEAAIRTHSAFTRFLGGKFLSLYSVTVFIASAGLIGLTWSAYLKYNEAANSFMETYISASGWRAASGKFRSLLEQGAETRSALLNNADINVVFSDYSMVDSLLTISNVSTNDYFFYTRDGNSIVITSNASDCSSSTDYGCEESFRVTDMEASLAALDTLSGNLTAAGYIWTGPDYIVRNASSTSGYPVINLIWAHGSDGSVNRLRIRSDTFSFSSDSLLDNNGGSARIWAVNGNEGTIISGFGVNTSLFSTLTAGANDTKIVSGTPISSLSSDVLDGGWLSALANIPEVENLPVSEIVDGMYIHLEKITDTPFYVIVGSKPVVNETLNWLLLASILVAFAPVVGTILVGTGYWLRLIAVRRRKRQHKLQRIEAEKAIKAVKDSKLKAAALVYRK